MFRTIMTILVSGLLGYAGAAPFAYIAQSGDGSVSVIDTASNVAIANMSVGAGAFGVTVNPAGTRVYVANTFDDTVSVIDTGTNRVIATVKVGEGPVGVAVNPAGTRVFVTNPGLFAPGSTMSVIDGATNSVIATVSVGRVPVGVAAHPDGGRVYVGNAFDDTISIIDVATNIVTETIAVPPGPSGIALSPDGARLYVASAGNPTKPGKTVSVIDTGSRSVVTTTEVGLVPIGIAVSPAGDRVYVANAGTENELGNTVSIIDAAANVVAATVRVGKVPQGISVDPWGSRVYVASLDSDSISIIDAATASVVATIGVGIGPTSFGNFIGPASTVLADTLGDLTGLWWNPSESGWGITLTQRRNMIFAAWYTYDNTGSPKWYVAPSCTISNIACPSCQRVASGTVYEVHGPTFFGSAFDPAAASVAAVGSLEITFLTRANLESRGATSASMKSNVNGAQRTVYISPQLFRGGAPPSLMDFSDLWWNPGESGWGLTVTQQVDVMFLAWYVYDGAGRPVWYVAPSCSVRATGMGCAGTLYRTTGPAFGPTFDPAQVRAFSVGSVTLSFSDRSNGLLSYTVDGVSSSKAITRQVF